MALYKNVNGTATLYSGAAGIMVGATTSAAGSPGLVPQPTVADKDKVLKGDGTWGQGGGYITYPTFAVGNDGHLSAEGGAGVDYTINSSGHLIATPQ